MSTVYLITSSQACRLFLSTDPPVAPGTACSGKRCWECGGVVFTGVNGVEWQLVCEVEHQEFASKSLGIYHRHIAKPVV